MNGIAKVVTESFADNSRGNNGKLSQTISFGLTVAFFLTITQLFDPALDEVRATLHEEQRIIKRVDASPDVIIHPPMVVATNNHDEYEVTSGRKRLIQLLDEAGFDNFTETQIQKIPEWKEVDRLYGTDVIIHGIDKCDEYRSTVQLEDRILGVAGMFNTGTNLLFLAMRNKILGLSHNTLWQVPWGKYQMAYVKWNYTAPTMNKYNKNNVLPVIIIRDPFSWMQSMCQTPKMADWKHNDHHCPNLIISAVDDNKYSTTFHEQNPLNSSFKVKVNFDENQIIEFNTLVHLWSEWYRLYLQVDYPLLIIRYEDLIYQPKEVLKAVADCAGVQVNDTLKLRWEGSEEHATVTDYIETLNKTADDHARLRNMTIEDVAFAETHLDHELMSMFKYNLPSERISR